MQVISITRSIPPSQCRDCTYPGQTWISLLSTVLLFTYLDTITKESVFQQCATNEQLVEQLQFFILNLSFSYDLLLIILAPSALFLINILLHLQYILHANANITGTLNKKLKKYIHLEKIVT